MATSIEEQGRYQDGNSIFENVFIQGTLNVATTNEKTVVRSNGITIDNNDGIETLRIESDGRVGIHSSIPAATLDIRDVGSTGPGILISGCTGIEGDLAVQDGEILHVGHFNSDTNTFTERLRITSGGDVTIGGNIGIGTDNPDVPLDVRGGGTLPAQFITTTGSSNGATIRIRKSDANLAVNDKIGEIQFAGDDGTDNYISEFAKIEATVDDATSSSEDGTLKFYTGTNGSSTEKLSILSGGDVSITDGNLIMASGHGIDFSDTADGTGTTSSEIFDDYEEGSFTPSYNTSNSNIGSVTYDARSGRYIKVGRLCFVTIRMRTDSISSVGSGSIRITGLPFTHVNVANNRAVSNNLFTSNWTGNNSPTLVLVGNNVTYMTLYQKDYNNDTASLQAAAFNTGANDNDIRLTAIYETST